MVCLNFREINHRERKYFQRDKVQRDKNFGKRNLFQKKLKIVKKLVNGWVRYPSMKNLLIDRLDGYYEMGHG